MYKCYDGQLLLPFDYEPEFIERDTSSMTEQNFVDRNRQIRSFIRSGERLQLARSEEYEYPDAKVPLDVKVDPTSVVGFDLSDQFLLSQELQQRIAEAKVRAAAANKSEAAVVKPEGVAGETGKSVPPTSVDGVSVN